MCPEEGCGREFYTQVGLDIHVKTHLPMAPEPLQINNEEKPVPKKTKTNTSGESIAKLNKNKITDKKAKELWKRRIKGMRTATTVEVSSKLNKKKFCQMLEVKKWHEIGKDGEIIDFDVKRFTAKNYVIKEIKKMSNDWLSIIAVGDNKQLVSWREGPINGRHHITIAKIE